MNHRIATLLAAEAASTAGTKTIDLNLSTPVSRITVSFKGLNSSNVPTAHPAKMVSKIELVDGSDVLFSLSGIEAQALNFYTEGRMPHNVCQYIDDAYAIATYEINFGRCLWDEVLALDPRKFTNPQLKITHDKALGGSAPDGGVLAIFAHIFDGKDISPAGFLMAKEQYSYTLDGTAKEMIDLATDYPYRLLIIKSLVAGRQPYQQYHDIKLSEDNDRRIVINDEPTSDLIKLLRQWPRMSELIMCNDIDAETTIYCTPTYETVVTGQGMDAIENGMFSDQSYGGSFDATSTEATNVQFMVNGLNPHGAMMVPFGKQAVIEDWYDVKDIGNLRLTITGGSGSSGACEIIAQQIRSY